MSGSLSHLYSIIRPSCGNIKWMLDGCIKKRTLPKYCVAQHQTLQITVQIFNFDLGENGSWLMDKIFAGSTPRATLP